MSERKKSSRSERKRAEIRTAAYRSFRDFGYHETTVDTICRTAGISKGSFYWHYDSKQEVFVDILDTWTREVMDELIRQFEDAVDQDNAASALSAAFEREVQRGRLTVPLWLEFTVLARRDPEIQRALARFYRRARAAIAEMLRPLVRGVLSEDQIQATSSAIFGAYVGIVMQDLADPSWLDAVKVTNRFMSVINWLLWEGTPPADLPSAEGPPDATGPVVERVPGVVDATGHPRADAREVDALVSAADPRAEARVRELRKLVLGVMPRFGERVISGWKVIAYDFDGLVCYIKPTRDGIVHLGFYDGVSLPDPNGLLAGSGKRQRRVDVPADPAVELNVPALRTLVAAAVAAHR